MPRISFPATTTATVTSVSIILAAAGNAGAAQKVVETVSGPTIDVGSAGTMQHVDFTTNDPITGVGLTAGWEFVQGDDDDGLFPWSLDLAATVTAPNGDAFQWGPNIGGDRTIADYPLQDASAAGLSGASAPGTYTFEWFNQPDLGGVSRLTDPQYHAMTTVPDVTFNYGATPDPATSWDRPFFIDGVSGLGPTAFDVFEFTVDTPGLYDFTSVRPDGEDHFTFLYSGSFDAAQPLSNLLDYGLGNGNSPFGVPQGTSAISALLFPGESYFWVTSEWDRFDDAFTADNTIVGPGVVIPSPGAAGLLALAGLAGVRRRRGG
jgi:hypothetical protein